MMTNSYGNKKFDAANEKARNALMRGPVFSWGQRVRGREDFFSLDLYVLSSYSHMVPIRFPKFSSYFS
jgi:hypothetical protein